MKKLRHWIISKLFTDDEKFLIYMAVYDRIKTLESISFNEKMADYGNIKIDCADLEELNNIFLK